MKVFPVTRARDEELLQWIAARRASNGSASALARRLGVSKGQLIRDTNAVMAADIAESGEDEARHAYW